MHFSYSWFFFQTTFKGVRYHKDRRQWQAYILDENTVHWLGFYDREEDAARAHDAEVIRRKGSTAELNFTTPALDLSKPAGTRVDGPRLGRPPKPMVQEPSNSGMRGSPARVGRPPKQRGIDNAPGSAIKRGRGRPALSGDGVTSSNNTGPTNATGLLDGKAEEISKVSSWASIVGACTYSIAKAPEQLATWNEAMASCCLWKGAWSSFVKLLCC